MQRRRRCRPPRTPQTPLRVRGIISRAQIERQLGAPVEVTPIASSFSEIERALV